MLKPTTTDRSPVGIFIIPFQVSPQPDVNTFKELYSTKASNNNPTPRQRYSQPAVNRRPCARQGRALTGSGILH